MTDDDLRAVIAEESRAVLRTLLKGAAVVICAYMVKGVLTTWAM